MNFEFAVVGFFYELHCMMFSANKTYFIVTKK